MQPAEAADAMKSGGQDVLEETADQFAWFQIDVALVAVPGSLQGQPLN